MASRLLRHCTRRCSARPDTAAIGEGAARDGGRVSPRGERTPLRPSSRPAIRRSSPPGNRGLPSLPAGRRPPCRTWGPCATSLRRPGGSPTRRRAARTLLATGAGRRQPVGRRPHRTRSRSRHDRPVRSPVASRAPERSRHGPRPARAAAGTVAHSRSAGRRSPVAAASPPAAVPALEAARDRPAQPGQYRSRHVLSVSDVSLERWVARSVR